MSHLLTAGEARAESPPCEPSSWPCDRIEVLGSSVIDGDTSVARDARFVVTYRSYDSYWTTDVTLLRDGAPVDAEVSHGVTTTPQAVWTAVKPRASLEPGTTYTLKVTSKHSPSGHSSATAFSFTTGDGFASRNDARPSVMVVSSRFFSHASADGLASATFDVEIHPAIFGRGGVYFVETKSLGEERFTASALAFDRGAPARVQLFVTVRVNEPTCFSAIYEDEAGRASVASEPTCATVADVPLFETPAPTEPGPPNAGGCASSPRRVDASWAAVAALVMVLARRTRPRTPSSMLKS